MYIEYHLSVTWIFLLPPCESQVMILNVYNTEHSSVR